MPANVQGDRWGWQEDSAVPRRAYVYGAEPGMGHGSRQGIQQQPKGGADSVQSLRAQAKAAGNLISTPQQEVKTETQEGRTVIVVQPANPQVVYVPQYNPQTVYTEPPPPAEDNSDKVVAAAVISFAVGIALGAAMSDKCQTSASLGSGEQIVDEGEVRPRA